MRTPALLLAVLAAALVSAASVRAAPPAGFYESRMLEPAASFVAGKPVAVYCALDDERWAAWAAANGTPDATATANIAGGTAEFEPYTCQVLRAQLTKRPAIAVSTYNLAASILLLVHEAVHVRTHSRDEAQTECSAMHEMPRVAVVYFHVKPGKQLRALMAQAWVSHRKTPASYRTLC